MNGYIAVNYTILLLILTCINEPFPSALLLMMKKSKKGQSYYTTSWVAHNSPYFLTFKLNGKYRTDYKGILSKTIVF